MVEESGAVNARGACEQCVARQGDSGPGRRGPDYIARHGLDREVFEPGNGWIAFVPTTGLRFRTEYNRINIRPAGTYC
jgi:hypothetical protein